MDLGRYIHQLLKHRNEVYVKGLGVFKRIHTSSVYDDRKGQYLPPVTYLEFDSKSTEGVDFIDYLQQANQISRSEAEALLEGEVLALLEQIKDNGSAILQHLGQLIKHGNSLVFKAEDLSGFHLPAIEGNGAKIEEPTEESNSEGISEVAVLDPEVESELIEQPALEATANEEVEALVEEPIEEAKPAKKSSLFIWASLLAIVIIAGLLYFNNQKKEEPEVLDKDSIKQETAIIPSNDSLANNSIDSLKLQTDSLVKVDSSVNAATEEKKPLIPAGHNFLIVIGTHSTLAQAYEQAESFNKAGINSVRVVPSNLAHNKKKVIWDSYATKAEADSALRYVQKHYVADAWRQTLK